MILNFRSRFMKWIKKHPCTSCFCGIYLLFSFSFIYFFHYDKNTIISKIIELFTTENLDKIAMTAVFIILMSGIETTLGFFLYGIWMTWNFIFLFLGRIFVIHQLKYINIFDLSGPSCLVFCPYLTFIFIHQPIIYFKIKKYRFTDTHLYMFGLFQYIFCIDPLNMMIDFVICIFSNLLFHLIYTLLKGVFHHTN